MEYPGYLRKSGRTATRRQNSGDGNPRFHVAFDDGTAYPTAKNAAVGYRIENSDYDGDVWVKIEHGQIIDIQPAVAS